jgi:polyketide synthase PksN
VAVCGIGSVKSNIGHLELAAGVAGVIKVLLQMQYKTLVKSLHCEQINPYIQLEDSPFYIVQENREWEVLRDSSGNALPRRAGVSSFGFGGANAHVVLEEYVPEEPTVADGGKPRPYVASDASPSPDGGKPRSYAASDAPLSTIIVLSAKNEERLHEQVRQLLAWVQAKTSTEEYPGQGQDKRKVLADQSMAQSLENLAYTLQVGRDAMEERLALQASSFPELEEKLQRYLQEPQEKGHWYRGQVKRHKETTALFSADEEVQEAMQEAVSKWIQHSKYEKLLEWWVKGLRIEWQHLYTVGAGSAQGTTIEAVGTVPCACPMATTRTLPRRISLPTYPLPVNAIG